MVGPISDEERRASTRVLAASFVGLIGISSGLMAFWGGASLSEAAIVIAAGIGVGTGLAVFLGSKYGP